MHNNKIELYYDHYKDTFEHILGYKKSRDKFFIFLITITYINFFNLQNPDGLSKIIFSLLSEKFGVQYQFNGEFLNSTLIFVFLSIVVKYFQSNINLERQYAYIHSLENKLQNKGLKITREGFSYLDKYPKILSIIHRIYTLVFPILLLILIGSEMYKHFNTDCTIYKILNYIMLSISFLIITSNIYIMNKRDDK